MATVPYIPSIQREGPFAYDENLGVGMPGAIIAQVGIEQRTYQNVSSPLARMIRGITEGTDAAKTITSVTYANPGVVTSIAHGYSTGNRLRLDSFPGHYSQGFAPLNGTEVTITVLTADTYSIGVNTTAYGMLAASTGTAAKLNNTMVVETIENHPFVTGNSVYCRVDGCDGYTHKAHRANNWTGGPLVHYTTLAPWVSGSTAEYVNLGGDAWTITKIDDRKFTIDGALWKVNITDAEPVFLSGVCYTTLVNAWPALQAASEFIAGRPFSRISAGVGFFAMTTENVPSQGGVEGGAVNLPGNSILEGVSSETTVFYRGDYFNRILFRHFESKCRNRNLTQYCNRQFQKNASHGWKITSTSEQRSSFDIAHENVASLAVPGYGYNNGHPGGKVRISYDHCTLIGASNDGADHKGPAANNPDGGEGCSADVLTGKAVGMGTVGTNRQIPITLTTANPIQVFAASGTFRVTLPFKAYVGQRITFGATTPTVDNLIFASKAFIVQSRISGSIVTMTYGSNANNNVTGGGGGITVIAPTLNKGKPLLDARAEGWRINGIDYIDVFGYSTGLRIRGGEGTNNNGVGGRKSVITNVRATSIANTVGDDDGEAFKGFTNLGKSVQATNIYANGNGFGQGIVISRGADYSSIQGIVERCDKGASLSSSNVNLKIKTISCVTTDVVVDGGNEDVFDILADALSITSGASIVTLRWGAAPATLIAGKTLVITGSEVIGGIVNTGGSWPIATVVSPGIFTFDSLQVATVTTVDGGGETISVTANNVATPNSGNKLELETFLTTGIGIDIAARVSGLLVRNSTSDGSGTPFVQNASATNVEWAAGNVGLPSELVVVNGKVLTVSNTMTQTATDGATVIFGAGGTVSYGGASGITINVSDITGGTSGRVLYDNAAKVGEKAVTGTGDVVLATSPTLITPALGTPASGVGTNLTGVPIATGISGLGADVATFLATPSSVNLLTAVTNETGTGQLVFATNPALVRPSIASDTFAGLPAASTAGRLAFVNNFGDNQVLFKDTGTVWKPVGPVVLETLDTVSAGTTNTEIIVFQFQPPAGILRVGDRIHIYYHIEKSGAVDTATCKLRVGTLGTIGDTVVMNNAPVLAATNRTGMQHVEFRIESATSILMVGNNDASAGVSQGYSAVRNTISGAAVTVTTMATNALFWSLTIISSGTTDTITIKAAEAILYPGPN